MKAFWDSRYAEGAFAYGKAPNVFFEQFLRHKQAGTILLPADGEGRNGVFAATQGWEVTAFDYSSSARMKALTLAAEFGVSIHYEVADVEQFNFEKQQYDVIGLFFVHLPPKIRTYLHRKVIDALKPNGQVVLEAFAPQQINFQSGGPRDAALLYDIELLKADFSDLHIDFIRDEITELQEGLYHVGTANVVRLIATKHT